MARTSPPVTTFIPRRQMLGGLGAGGLAFLPVPGGSRASAASNPPMAGTLDLASVSVVDSHMHPVGRTLISTTYAQQAQAFAAAVAPDVDDQRKAAWMSDAVAGDRDLIWNAPRRIGYFDYISRVYGVPPTIAGFDQVIAPHIRSDAEFSAYVKIILDRENIQTVVLQAAEEAPAPPATLIPNGRYVWTTVVSDFTRRDWANARGLTSLSAVLNEIDATMQRAAENGARGFKNVSAYYRPLRLTKPTQADADAAFQRLLRAVPATGPSQAAAAAKSLVPGPKQNEPRYESDPVLRDAVICYEDFLFRYIYATAGRLQRPIIIHSAVALHPSLRTEFNDPRPLYDVFTDPDIEIARTKFVIIHTGYPWQAVMAAFISQFPNVYTDVSFYSKYPGALRSLYESLLAIGPSTKIMHGSDANSVPEEIGYCAWNSRAVLGKVLTAYKDDWGWTQSDISRAATDILADNARRVFSIAP